MIVFFSASGGCDETAGKYRRVLAAAGCEVLSGGATGLAKADACFICLAGADNAALKADLNMALDRKLPVAYSEEDGAAADRGLRMQLGLAQRVKPEAYETDIADWLAGVRKQISKQKARKLIFRLCVLLMLFCGVAAGVLATRSHNEKLAEEARLAAELAQKQREEEYQAGLINGVEPEKLTVLAMPDSGLSDIAFLSKAVNIEELDLSGNDITDISPLGSLTKLKKLDLSNNRINDVNVLLALPALKELDISGNPLTDTAALDYMEGVEIKR